MSGAAPSTSQAPPGGGDSVRPPDRRVDLRITCTRCKGKPSFRQEVPTWLVGAMALAYHAAHEGHPLELEVDGVIYRAHENRVLTPNTEKA